MATGPSPYQQSGQQQATFTPGVNGTPNLSSSTPYPYPSYSSSSAPPPQANTSASGASFDQSSPSDLLNDSAPLKAVKDQYNSISQRYQGLLDHSTPYVGQRWISTVIVLFLFMTRILVAQGWYIVCYALGIYLLNLFLAFLTPKFDPSIEMDEAEIDAEEGTANSPATAPKGLMDGQLGGSNLPTKSTDEFKPFIRRLPEFKFWHSATKAIIIALFCTFFSVFDIPVFWPILVIYFFTLTALTLRRQIRHMIRYRYVPFDIGKTRYSRK